MERSDLIADGDRGGPALGWVLAQLADLRPRTSLGYPALPLVVTIEELADEADLHELLLARWEERLGVRRDDVGRATAGAALLTDVANAVTWSPAAVQRRAQLDVVNAADTIALGYGSGASVAAVGWLAPRVHPCAGCELLPAGMRAALAPLSAATAARCGIARDVADDLAADAIGQVLATAT